ncbi:hypothetical protein Vadar_022687 [Vaccinium darrowii]|uniref:Uncharacterized protein n=1 Tax=Vaccinium darrowii TaxID=229202 RepID=A0ACB7YFU8_9ERIC|nr:hypothetical protein Vadar_022687 [Vaccinium darrowii]
MNQLIVPFLLLLSFFCHVEAQSNQNNLKSSIAVVASLVGIIFVISLVLILCTALCHRRDAVHHNQQTPDGLLRPPVSRYSGIDKIVIESLPFFKFSALGGLRSGLECAVCLSKFQDIEILRLLPKCKHAFHINCIDKWLENHSSCPLCREKISIDDLTYSNSLRFLSSQSEVRQDSNVELFVQREESHRKSSRFSIGSSSRRSEKSGAKEDEFRIREDHENNEEIELFHKFNHKIIMSNAVLKSRWSNLSSSDLLFLNSEMLRDVSSNRFPPLDSNTHANSNTWVTEEGRISKIIREEMEGKRGFETEVGKVNQNDSYPLLSGASTSDPTKNLLPNEKRSMSEIAGHSRFDEFSSMNISVTESSVPENAAAEERMKRLWMPIARKTVQWYANWDKKSQRLNYTKKSLNV